MADKYLAFDLGAESGRGVIGSRLKLAEAGRFKTTPDSKEPGPDGVWRWEIDKIVAELKRILAEVESHGALAGIAVDTWGVDYGLLDRKGELLEAPVCYRDLSHAIAKTATLNQIPAQELWAESGIQLLPFNTLFQLAAVKARNPSLLDRAAGLAFMPDLLASRLSTTPIATSEITIASTSAMLDPVSREWNEDLLARLGMPHQFLFPIADPGASYGATAAGTPVFAAAGHDTASAVAAVPAAMRSTWAYISSGTWSLVGVERAQPLLTMESLGLGLSNEIGVGRQTRLLKNVMGLWLVQECRRSLARGGQDLGYEELTALAASSPSNGPLVDATDHRFITPADMPGEIRKACIETDQMPPGDVGALIRCCLDSLALAYRLTLADLERVLGVRFEVLHIVGGGGKNRLLNQLAADACGIPVVAGPAEATAAGNVLAQMIGRGVLANWEEARQVSLASFQPETFTNNPKVLEFWIERNAKFAAM